MLVLKVVNLIVNSHFYGFCCMPLHEDGRGIQYHSHTVIANHAPNSRRPCACASSTVQQVAED